jgi:hypothetical protein
MRRTPARVGLALAALLAAGSYVFPPLRRGAVEATLEVHVAGRGPAPGLAAAQYEVRLRGPAGLECDPPRLGDAAAAWKADRIASAWSEEGDRVEVSLDVHLTQVKPGAAPLPDLRLRFRPDAGAAWEEAEWLDILRQARDGPPPEPYTPEPARPWWLLPAAAVLVVVLAAAGWLRWRRRPVPAPPVPAAVRALKELERLEESALPPAGHSAAFHTRASEVLRRYLAERFGLPALERTTAEFLSAAVKVPELAAYDGRLREFLERCDLAKFAGAGLSAEQCRHSAALARELIGRTRTPPPGGA